MSTYKWKDIKHHPRLKLVYTEKATDAETLPFPVRNYLGDLLIEKTETKLKTLEERKAFNAALVEKLNHAFGYKVMWNDWTRLIFPLTGRKHNHQTIYATIYTNMQCERKYAPKLIKDLATKPEFTL